MPVFPLFFSPFVCRSRVNHRGRKLLPAGHGDAHGRLHSRDHQRIYPLAAAKLLTCRCVTCRPWPPSSVWLCWLPYSTLTCWLHLSKRITSSSEHVCSSAGRWSAGRQKEDGRTKKLLMWMPPLIRIKFFLEMFVRFVSPSETKQSGTEVK